MMLTRLAHWAFRRKVIQCWIVECPRCGLKKDPWTAWDPHDVCPGCSFHIPQTFRPPTLIEAVTGVSN